MLENLIPAGLTLGGAALAVKLLVAGVRDPSHRPPTPPSDRVLDHAVRPELPHASR